MKTRKEIMVRAHEIARTLEGSYSARMSYSLKKSWEEARMESKTNVEVWENSKIISIDVDGKQVAIYYKLRKSISITNKTYSTEFINAKIEEYQNNKKSTANKTIVTQTISNDTATVKQINYIRALLYKTGETCAYPENYLMTLTKKEASNLIAELSA